MSKQGTLYQFILWLNSILRPIGFVEIVLQTVSQSEYYKYYEVKIGNRTFTGNEEQLEDKLVKFIIEEMSSRIKELS